MSRSFNEPDAEQVESLLRAMVGRHVAVVGDLVLDEYLTGKVGRISQEAPVPVFDVTGEQHTLGGAANTAKCLVALGAKVSLCGVIGKDRHADMLLDEACNLGMDTAGILADPARPTTFKSRVVAKQQQMMRIDRETTGPVNSTVEGRLVKRVEKAVRQADAVVLSDYSKGALTRSVSRAAIKAAGRKPVIVDPKHLPWDHYRGATLIKPNRPEASWFSGQDVAGDERAVKVARAIMKKLSIQHALITRGENGMTLAYTSGNGRSRAAHFRPLPHEVFDATGCGDVVAAVLALAMAAGADAPTAAFLANVAGGVEVTKFGTAVVSDSEILEAVGGPTAEHDAKVLSREQAAAAAADLRRRGKTIVFTNGCFDLLHVGHVTYLQQSRQKGDALIVGINTDASVRRLKGAGRPVQTEHDRARIIASQACVDAVVLFDEDTPLELIKALRPDVLTKGNDYRRKQEVVGWELVERWGGRVELIDLVKGRSTTKLIEQTHRGERGGAKTRRNRE